MKRVCNQLSTPVTSLCSPFSTLPAIEQPQNNKNTYLCGPKKQTDKRNEYEIYTQTNMGDNVPDPGQFVDGTFD